MRYDSVFTLAFFFHRSCAAIPLSYTIFTILYDFPAMRYVFFSYFDAYSRTRTPAWRRGEVL